VRRPPSPRELGDFQTPAGLAARCCELLSRLERGLRPALVVEPTCGRGAFVVAAARAFPRARVVGLDIDAAHLAAARRAVRAAGIEPARVTLRKADVFEAGWDAVLAGSHARSRSRSSDARELLVLGNPPWVTNAEVGRLGGTNLPPKRNLKGLNGCDAITGASNFDVSEWLLIAALERLQGREATVAMLCKSAVARRVVEHAARKGLDMRCDGLWRFDARAAFGASVEAGFLVFSTTSAPPGARLHACPVLELDGPTRSPAGAFGVVDGVLVSDPAAAARWGALRGEDGLRWRSGLKHDCAPVMELRHLGGDRYVNGLGEEVRLETEHLYPLLKCSDLRHGRVADSGRRVIVTQRRPGDDTAAIASQAPRTWAYLMRHRARLDGRASSVYAHRPPFAVFGVGPYSFAHHKVAVSGLHKTPRFVLVGTIAGRPVMLDDTCYFLGFETEALARTTQALLETEPARALLRSLIFEDAKRPVTRRLLEQIHLGRLASWAAGDGVTGEGLELDRLRALAG
jgi:hypothetical protein